MSANRKRKQQPQPEPVAVVVSPDPVAPKAAAMPAGVRTRASLRTHGPIGVHYEETPKLEAVENEGTARAAREDTEEV